MRTPLYIWLFIYLYILFLRHGVCEIEAESCGTCEARQRGWPQELACWRPLLSARPFLRHGAHHHLPVKGVKSAVYCKNNFVRTWVLDFVKTRRKRERQNYFFLHLWLVIYFFIVWQGAFDIEAESCKPCEARQRGGRKLQAKGLYAMLGLVWHAALGYLLVKCKKYAK